MSNLWISNRMARSQYNSAFKGDFYCPIAPIWNMDPYIDNVNIFFQIHKELKLTLKEYYENYICGTEDEEIQAQDSSSEASRPSTSLSLTSVSVDPNRWMNRCLFQCNLCGVQFDSRINFRSHIQTIHNMEYDDYIGNYGDPTILTNLHGCLMCSEMIVNDSEDIAEHLNVAHGT